MKKIVIAENIFRNVDNSVTVLKRGGLTLYTARSSEEILDLHRAHIMDLIITEFSLPRMGGGKLCSAIRSDYRLRDVSMLLVCDADELADCRNSGPNAVLCTPVDSAELFSRIAELLLIPKRQDMRTFLHVAISGGNGSSSFLGVSQNISISGMLLETEGKLSIGDRLVCSFSISAREVVAEVVVTRAAAASRGKFQYGVKFVNLATKSLILIDQLVTGRIKH